jgi:hypothetical protein
VTAPPPECTATLRLPPHRLEVDEARFLRLLCSSFSLHIIEKRALIRRVPKLRQDQINGLMGILEEEAAWQEQQNAADPARRQAYAQAIGQQQEKWQAMERKIEAGDWP